MDSEAFSYLPLRPRKRAVKIGGNCNYSELSEKLRAAHHEDVLAQLQNGGIGPTGFGSVESAAAMSWV